DQLVFGVLIPGGRHPIDVSQQIEAFDDRQIPPQLRALPEDRADACDVTNALAPRYEPAHLAASTRRLETPAENLERSRFPGAVRPDESEQLTLGELETHAPERLDRAPPPADESRERAERPRAPLGDPERFRQLVDDDVGRGHAPMDRGLGRSTLA